METIKSILFGLALAALTSVPANADCCTASFEGGMFIIKASYPDGREVYAGWSENVAAINGRNQVEFMEAHGCDCLSPDWI